VPPLAIQDEANAVRQEFADRFNSRKAFNSPPHITLQPPFHWSLAAVDQLAATVTAFARSQTEFTVDLQGFGAFAPRVIYIDVVKSPALGQLKTDLSQHLEEHLGICDRSPHPSFCPHLTVAFRDLSRSAFDAAWPEFEQRTFRATFTATHLTLLMHQQRWTVYQHFALESEH